MTCTIAAWAAILILLPILILLHITESRKQRRRRLCPQCKHKFTTYERSDDEGTRYGALSRKVENTLQVLEFMQHNITTAIAKLKELDEEVM